VIIRTQVNARAGLLGNPSDLYGGKVISCLIEDFAARIELWESPLLTFRLHPQYDRTEFADLADLVNSVTRHGYYGMQRVLFATCRRFVGYCEERGVKLRQANFTIAYETNIPRQSGLGGSSGAIIAALRALVRFHRVPAEVLPPAELAKLALSVETKELGIAAGLQDRVVQSYDGLTYMDFAAGDGRYERMDSSLLPEFGLAWVSERQMGTQESGQVHTPVRFRWEQGDPVVRRAIRGIARCAEGGREALLRGDIAKLGRLMDRNFELRREMFGDAGPERHNVRLVEIAREAGCAAKLPGSGGAAIILLTDRGDRERLAKGYAAEGYQYRPIKVR
jgi:glucuronokinase